MKKLKYLVLILMILVFLSGLGVLLYPYIRGYLVDRQIERTAEEFLSRVETDPISPYPSESQLDQDTPSDSPEPTEPDTYTDLWRDMVDYNKEIYINGQKGLDCKLAYEDPSFVLADYGLESEVFAVISIPALELEMPVFLGANYGRWCCSFRSNQYPHRRKEHKLYHCRPSGMGRRLLLPVCG